MTTLREYKNPLVIICFGVLFGTTFNFREISIYILLSTFICSLIFYFSRKDYLVLLFSFSVLFGYFYTGFYNNYFFVNLDDLLGKRQIYTGEIIGFDNDSSIFYKKYFLKLKHLVSEKNKYELSGTKVQVLGTSYEEYFPGDIVQISGKLKKPKSAVLPGLFDEKKYLQAKGINYILKAEPGTLVFLDEPFETFFTRKINELRDYFLSVNNKLLPDKNAQLVNGIILGSKASMLNGGLKETVRNLGLSHITSASGFNISILSGAIFYIFYLLFRKNRILPVLVSILAVVLYTFLCDCSASILRAAVFITFVLIGSVFDKKLKILPGISLIVLIFYLFNPYNVLDIGLQLSVLAFLGITLFTLESKQFAVLFQSLFAQVMVMPLLVFYFHNIQLLGVLANLIAVPLASLILVVGLVNICLIKISFLQPVFGFVLNILSDLFLNWVNLLNKISFKQLYLPNIDFYFLILTYVFLIFALSAIFIPLFREKLKYISPIFLILFALVYFVSDTTRYLKLYIFPLYNRDLILMTVPKNAPVLFGYAIRNADTDLVKRFLRLNNLKENLVKYDFKNQHNVLLSDKLISVDKNIIRIEYKDFSFEVVKNYSSKIKPQAKYIKLPILMKKDPPLDSVFVSEPKVLIVNDYKKLSKKSVKSIGWLKKQKYKTYFLSETGTITLISDGLNHRLYTSGE